MDANIEALDIRPATVAVLGQNVSVWNVERIWARIPEDPTDG